MPEIVVGCVGIPHTTHAGDLEEEAPAASASAEHGQPRGNPQPAASVSSFGDYGFESDAPTTDAESEGQADRVQVCGSECRGTSAVCAVSLTAGSGSAPHSERQRCVRQRDCSTLTHLLACCVLLLYWLATIRLGPYWPG